MLLIAVKSCLQSMNDGYHEIIMDTWGKDIPFRADLKFFMGEPARSFHLSNNEVALGVPDEYDELPRKTKAILGWSLWNRYDYTFLCDTDTFIIPERLIECGYHNWDFSGRFGAMPQIGTTFNYRDPRGTYPDCHPWASGGVGYFLSRKAGEIVARSWPTVWAEDMWVGQVLGPHIQKGEITASDLPIECDSAWHFPRREYNQHPYHPKFGWMHKMYKEHKNEN